MTNIPDIVAAALSIAVYPVDSPAASDAKKELEKLQQTDSSEKAEIQSKFWEFISKEAVAVVDMVGACPTYLLPVLKYLPIAGTVANWSLLTTTLIPQANNEIAGEGKISPSTSISIIGAIIGLIPTGSWIAAGLKMAASYIGMAPGSLPAEWSADLVNLSPGMTEYVFKVITDIDIFAKYIDDEKRNTYNKLLDSLQLQEAVKLAIEKDLSAQRLLTYGDDAYPGMTDSVDRPDAYWGERAQFLALKLKGDITGTYEGYPHYGEAGIYEGFIGAAEISGYVGIVTPGIGDTLQFGVQGYTAGSLFANDRYWGTSADDVYSGLGGSDTIYGFEGDDKLLGDIGDDKIFGGIGNDTLLGGLGSDSLKGEDGSDVLNGGLGSDYLFGGAGNDWLGYDAAGIAEGSVIERDSDGNYYEGGTGNDHLFGSTSADRIRFNQGDGSDVVTGNGGADILEYAAGGNFLTTTREGKDLVLSRTLPDGTVDRIVMLNWYADKPSDAMRLVRVDFGAIDPTTGQFVLSGALDQETLHQQGLHKQIADNAQELRGDLVYYQETLQGSSRSDSLYSSQAADDGSVGDILVGGKGDDYLYGSIGADKVRLWKGDGADVFRGNGGADIIEAYDGLSFKSSSTHLDQVGTNLVITFANDTKLTVLDWTRDGASMAFREGANGYAVGSDWIAQHLTGIYGDAAANLITGNALSNVLYGYAGNDRLVGGGGNDEFWGGADNDQLTGGTGNDVFHYSKGDGIDQVWGGGGSDVLDFQGSGLGYAITATRAGSDLRLSYSANDSVTVHDWFASSSASMQVKLPNGQLVSAATINEGFNTTSSGWTSGVYNSSNFLAVLYGFNSNFQTLDQKYQATWGKSFFANAFNGAGQSYYAGFSIDGQPVYNWGAGIGNAYATPGKIIYGDVWWSYWSNGKGGYNFVITHVDAGQVANGWSYDSGNPGGLNQNYITKNSWSHMDNPVQQVPSTRESYVLFNGTKMAGAVTTFQAKQSMEASHASDFDALLALSTFHAGQDDSFAGSETAQMSGLHRISPLQVDVMHTDGFAAIIAPVSTADAFSMV